VKQMKSHNDILDKHRVITSVFTYYFICE